ncbi:LytR family transcriptional regulator [Leptospira ognonensis]|uniref:LytR family transcriptional regulator n=1 Tax=Leptospira ognonensis TaxID=2484945 RepID=A0A4R9JY74_9LEPT|nr:LytR C-terminal domain-containing protein [Leptospira ognonensis]TGL57507.1 LytR family transcriptional regulator [Leptospira ognonensis]
MLQESQVNQKKPFLLLSIAGAVLLVAMLTLFLKNKTNIGSELKLSGPKKTNYLISMISDNGDYLFSFYAEFYHQEKKAALFFVNPLTSFEDEKTLEDYGKDAPDEIYSSLEDTLDHSIQHKIVITETNFHQIVNLLGGMELFFEPRSNRITKKYKRVNRIYNLDGEDCYDVLSYLEDRKLLSYIHRLEIQENTILSLFETFHQKRDLLSKQKIGYLHDHINNNLSLKDWELFFEFFKKDRVHFGVSELPAEPIARVKKKDEILKTHEETVKVAFNKFSSDVRSSYYSDGERARIEILNGTSKSGLARYGKALLNDKGLKVLSVDNAWDSNFDKSIILNRSGNTQYTDTISETFQGRKVYFALRKDLGLDATVVLGEDFQNSKE